MSKRKHLLYRPSNFAAQDFFQDEDILKAKYVVHTVLAAPIWGAVQEGGWTNLSSAALREDIGRNYRHILNTLKSNHILECDNYFEVGYKCRGYKLREPYASAEVVKDTDFFERSIPQQRLLPVHKFLRSWVEKLEIEGLPTDIRANALKDKFFWFQPEDDFGGRFHSNLTNLDSMLRSQLSLNGEKLIAYDIKCSQPYFLSLLYHYRTLQQALPSGSGQEFIDPQIEEIVRLVKAKQESELLGSPSSNSLNALQAQTHNTLHTQETYHHFAQGEVKHSGFNDFCSKTAQGQFYDFVANLQGVKREEIKQEWMLCYGKRTNCKWLKPLFPSIYKFMCGLKKKDYRHCSQKCQRLESAVVIHRIANQWSLQYPDKPLLTVHDSFVTVASEQETLKAFLDQQFAELPWSPTLKLEDWSIPTQKRSRSPRKRWETTKGTDRHFEGDDYV